MGGLVYKLLLLPKTQIECKQSTRKFKTMHFLGTWDIEELQFVLFYRIKGGRKSHPCNWWTKQAAKNSSALSWQSHWTDARQLCHPQIWEVAVFSFIGNNLSQSNTWYGGEGLFYKSPLSLDDVRELWETIQRFGSWVWGPNWRRFKNKEDRFLLCHAFLWCRFWKQSLKVTPDT